MKNMLLVILVAVVGLIAGPAMATGEEPGICLDVFFECRDATAYNEPIEFYGVATNCSDVPLVVLVKDAVAQELLLPESLLAPGESVNWLYQVVPETPDDCPAYQSLMVKVSGTDGTTLKTLWVEDSCDCGPKLTSLCATPGFWGLHAGEEKKDSQNITQAVIEAAGGGLEVCGIWVDNTMLDMPGSALEGMCLANREEKVLQFYRHMIAASLNCVMSGSPNDCDGTEIEQLYSDCTDLCIMTSDWDVLEECSNRVDCWNNGGTMLASGMCQLGTCAVDGAPCESKEDCGFNDTGEPIECVPLGGTCHDRPLVNEALGLDFDPPGPASSSKACNAAIKNDCDLLSCD